MTQIESQVEQVQGMTEQDEQGGQVEQMGQKAKQFRRRLPAAREVLFILWRAIKEGEELLSDPDPQVRLKALHAISAVGGQYIKGLEVVDVQARIKNLETVLKTRGE